MSNAIDIYTKREIDIQYRYVRNTGITSCVVAAIGLILSYLIDPLGYWFTPASILVVFLIEFAIVKRYEKRRSEYNPALARSADDTEDTQ